MKVKSRKQIIEDVKTIIEFSSVEINKRTKEVKFLDTIYEEVIESLIEQERPYLSEEERLDLKEKAIKVYCYSHGIIGEWHLKQWAKESIWHKHFTEGYIEEEHMDRYQEEYELEFDEDFNDAVFISDEDDRRIEEYEWGENDKWRENIDWEDYYKNL